MAHKFKVGEAVQLVEGRRHVATSAVRYKIVRQLPQGDGERSYRIKSASENFERVAIESQLVKG